LEEKASEQVVKGLLERRADVGVYVEGTPDEGLDSQYFRGDELVLILPAKHPLSGQQPIAFADALDEQWISLNPGAALLQQQQTAAMALGRRLKLRMQVNSFDAVSHMVAAGLGVAMLPKASALPIIQSMKVSWRPLQDAWAQRRLMIAVRTDADQDVRAFRSALILSSQNTKAD
jgi:DNA-binding transcriptional LysR family regulator